MVKELSGNLLIIQSGVSSAVSNATLYGVLTESLNYEVIEEIYGIKHGFEGLLKGRFLDLASLSQQWVKKLLHTAGCVLGTESPFFKAEQINESIIQGLKERNIRFVVCVGDKDSISLCKQLLLLARKVNYEVQVIAIPHSSYNDLPISDHSLGYGSYLKYLNAYLSDLENSVVGGNIKVGVCEVSGGASGWLVAGSSLVKNKHFKIENPYVVCLPEQPFNEDSFIQAVTDRIQSQGYALVITNNNLVNEDGEYIVFEDKKALSAGDYLSNLVSSHLKVSVSNTKCNLNMAPLSTFISLQDQQEAILCGKETVKALLNGENEKSVVLIKGDSENYTVEVSFVTFQEMLENTKFFPADWILENAFWLNFQFLKYALPLIQGEINLAHEKGIPSLASLPVEGI